MQTEEVRSTLTQKILFSFSSSSFPEAYDSLIIIRLFVKRNTRNGFPGTIYYEELLTKILEAGNYRLLHEKGVSLETKKNFVKALNKLSEISMSHAPGFSLQALDTWASANNIAIKIRQVGDSFSVDFSKVHFERSKPPAGIPPESIPEGTFFWGVSTAGGQWEGENPHSIWAVHEKNGKVGDPLKKAANGLEMFETDIESAAGMGLNAFRTSIEWSRIEPEPGKIDPKGVAFYHKLFQAMRKKGLTPIVTLIHFSWPQWLEDQAGGWGDEKAVRAFCRYVAFVAKEFGSEVDWWLTFNEPPVVIIAGYILGTNAPGYKNPVKALQVTRSWIRCHKLAYRIIHDNDKKAFVSWNNYSGSYSFGPFGSIHFSIDGDSGARAAQNSLSNEKEIVDRITKTWEKACSEDFLRNEKDSKYQRFMDFIGLDYYCRWRIPGKYVPAFEWEIDPEGFYEVLKNYHKWTKLPVLVAENGMATKDLEPREDGWTREAFLVQHVKQLKRAMKDGIPVIGYIHWSITDNWEWGYYQPRFGLYQVDCKNENFERVPTEAVEVYRTITEKNGVTPDLENRYPDPRRKKDRK